MKVVINKENEEKTVKQIALSLKISTRLLTRLKGLPDGITVNGESKTVRAVVHENDIVCFKIDDEKSSMGIHPFDAPATKLFEDEWYEVWAKPAGLPTHPAKRHQLDTLASRIMAQKKDENFVFRSLTRLDLDTSGAVILAKNQLAANEFSKLLISRNVKKEYIAVCLGKIESNEGKIDYRIKRLDERRILRGAVLNGDEGDEALTYYKVLKKSDSASLVLLSIPTGRTHQIRVHMQAIGHPVLSDTLYSVQSPYIQRQALHAHRITFTHPFTKKTISVSCPLFDDMRKCIKNIFGEDECF